MSSQSRDVLNPSYLQSYLLQSLNMALGACYSRRRVYLCPSSAMCLYP